MRFSRFVILQCQLRASASMCIFSAAWLVKAHRPWSMKWCSSARLLFHDARSITFASWLILASPIIGLANYVLFYRGKLMTRSRQEASWRPRAARIVPAFSCQMPMQLYPHSLAHSHDGTARRLILLPQEPIAGYAIYMRIMMAGAASMPSLYRFGMLDIWCFVACHLIWSLRFQEAGR